MHDDELWQDLLLNGEPVQEPRKKGQQLPDGHICAAVYLWVWREREGIVEVLLQQRASNKRTWSGYWDVSAAGHINFDEQPIQAVIREAEEEIGLNLSADQLYFAGVYRLYQRKYVDQLLIPELQWIYTYKASEEVASVFLDGEVSNSEWYPVEKLLDRSFIENLPVVNHDPEYFALIHKTIAMQ